jgi:TPR repeat protein
MIKNGRGVAQDSKAAAKWYRKAAEQGHAKAQYNLGVRYAKGDGVFKNYIYAYMWLDVSASNGHVRAGKSRDILEERMTVVDKSIAQRLAKVCKKQLNDHIFSLSELREVFCR